MARQIKQLAQLLQNAQSNNPMLVPRDLDPTVPSQRQANKAERIGLDSMAYNLVATTNKRITNLLHQMKFDLHKMTEFVPNGMQVPPAKLRVQHANPHVLVLKGWDHVCKRGRSEHDSDLVRQMLNSPEMIKKYSSQTMGKPPSFMRIEDQMQLLEERMNQSGDSSYSSPSSTLMLS
ncbi:hypothetical protein NE237_025342 [Protea cynaroides]|uniref:Uncharacterized protein n=1 Tax=Protea cynaroides TaxID=273540 RepID=A0A9Q0K020_9MAGN|nr:hypothetical protein NE237_025342 [Protea cynaroides]